MQIAISIYKVIVILERESEVEDPSQESQSVPGEVQALGFRWLGGQWVDQGRRRNVDLVLGASGICKHSQQTPEKQSLFSSELCYMIFE